MIKAGAVSGIKTAGALPPVQVHSKGSQSDCFGLQEVPFSAMLLAAQLAANAGMVTDCALVTLKLCNVHRSAAADVWTEREDSHLEEHPSLGWHKPWDQAALLEFPGYLVVSIFIGVKYCLEVIGSLSGPWSYELLHISHIKFRCRHSSRVTLQVLKWRVHCVVTIRDDLQFI